MRMILKQPARDAVRRWRGAGLIGAAIVLLAVATARASSSADRRVILRIAVPPGVQGAVEVSRDLRWWNKCDGALEPQGDGSYEATVVVPPAAVSFFRIVTIP